MGKALGLIEFIGYVPAVCAADTALKAANVDLIGIEKVTGGIVTVKVTGDVDAVYAAVESAENFASRIGSLRSAHVIPRLDDEVEALLINEKKERERLKKLEDENELARELEEVNEEANTAIQNGTELKQEIQESESEIKEEPVESDVTIQVETLEIENKDEDFVQVEIEEVKVEEDIEQEFEKLENIEEVQDEIREEKADESEIDIKKISKMRVKDLRKKIKSLNPTINTNKLKSLKKKDLVEILLKYGKEGEN
ncbi:BMC domain-containing protein [Clostridium sp. B9]|uniref:BMC domain-containing protein n=1 Tax=Clostridium sp. B9 TaxID=3423224 RepID=UPI003D2EBD54